MKKQKGNTLSKRTLALLLSVLMTLSTFPASAFAGVEIAETVSAVLPLEQTDFSVESGTALTEIGLPTTLLVKVSEPSSEEGEEATFREENLAVTWRGNYDAEAAGTYKLTAVFPEHVILSEDVFVPEVMVTVLPAKDETAIEPAESEEAKKEKEERAIESAESEEAKKEIVLLALTDPVQVPDATNYIKLDPNNTILKTPEDFGIGKLGELEFAVSFLMTPNDIPQEQRKDVAAVFTIPSGFSVENMPFVAGVSFTKRINSDGSTTVIARCDEGTTSVVGQFTLRQNSKTLLSQLAATKGTYNFDVQLYAGYGTDHQIAVTTPTSGSGYTSRLILQGDATTPTWTISNTTEVLTSMPGEVFLERANQGLNDEADASSDALRTLFRNDKIRNGFKITLHKSKGYLTDGTTINMEIPKLGEIFEHSNAWIAQFVTDSGQTIDEGNVNNGYMMAIGDAETGFVKLNAASKSTWTNGNDYAVPRGAAGLSYADTYYEAGTFTITYFPKVYYNRLYDGDWSNTSFTADSGCSVTYTEFETGTMDEATGTPLKYQLIQGTKNVAVGRDLDLSTGNTVNLSEIKQYSTLQAEYNDSALLKAVSPFDNATSDFKIQDQLKISYDYTEALSPIELQNLGTAKQFGLTYRIFVTDATTGNLVRIETLLDEETSQKPYTPQTLSGVQETVLENSPLTEWTLNEADTAGNKLFVSRIEVSKAQYEYNKRGDGRTVGFNLNYGLNVDNQSWFNYRLRAYHHRLSSGEDIPNNYQAKIHREITSDQIAAQGAPIVKDYIVTTKHLNDNIEMFINVNDGMFYGRNRFMEVNDHPETGNYGNYAVRKMSDTMDYNVDSEGNTIPFGKEGYDPVVVELSGDAVTLTDRIERNHQRLIGLWDDQGIYHDLAKEGVDPEAFLVDAQCSYGEKIETTSMRSDHNFQAYSGQLYSLDKIYEKLDISYAKKLVMALDDINSWNVPNQQTVVKFATFINKVAPGYLNYDGVIGKNGSKDLPKQLNFKGALYCKYSDYRTELVGGGSTIDSNGGTNHGTANAKTYGAATLIHGIYPSAIAVYDQDYYVNPYSALGRGDVGKDIGYGFIGNGLAQGDKTSFIELTRVKVTTPASAQSQMQYKGATMDFSGTDPKLLALTNVVSFNFYQWQTIWKFKLDYTLSNREQKVVDATLVQAAGDGGRTYYRIPDVDINNGIYLTSLKVIFPDDCNWGGNGGKYPDIWALAGYQNAISDIGLGIYNVNIPSTYPGTEIKVGSVSDHDKDNDYDKLTVKATLRFNNLFGEPLAESTGVYASEGASDRIKNQQVEVSKLVASDLSYGTTSTNQGQAVSVNSLVKWAATNETFKLMKENDIRVRPTYYYKIDKNFSYVDGTAYCQNRDNGKKLEKISVTFIPAGMGEGASGNADYGILKISYDAADYEALLGTYPYSERWDILRFNLQAAFDAPPVVVKPIFGLWMDTSFDANRDGNGGNESGIVVETTNGNNQLLDTAPLGDLFGNTTSAKNTNGDGKAEMLYADITKTHKINEQAVLGVAPYAIAKSPYQENTSSVTSRDLVEVKNLFSEKVYMSGDTTTDTKDWEVYIPIMKKGEQQKYHYGGEDKWTKANDFSVDFMDIHTGDLDGKALKYHVYYTTDSNPAANGYDGAKAATWTEFKNNTGEAVSSLPDELSTVTMIKVMVDQIVSKDKIFFVLDYNLSQRKTVVGDQQSQNAFYANFSVGNAENLYFGTLGQSLLPLSYNLKDMAVTGFVWNESDYNSLYDADDSEKNTLFQGATLQLFNTEGKEVSQTGNSANITNSNGQYSLLMPNDGDWNVKILLPEGKKLVNQNKSGEASVDSAFDRTSNQIGINFKPDVGMGRYTMTNLNAGIYDKPIISITPEDPFFKVGTTENTLTATVDHRAPGTLATILLKEEEPTDIAVIKDNGDETAKVSGLKTGVVTCVSSIDDGYGGEVQTENDVIIYANVKYDANTGTGKPPVDENRYYPSVDDPATDEATIASGDTISKKGYLFTGWSANPEDEEADYKGGDTLKIGAVKEDVTLYAIWKPITYQVVYHQNDIESIYGKDLDGTPASESFMNGMIQNYIYNVEQELIKSDFVLKGYDFTGWNTEKDGTGTAFQDEERIINLTETDEETIHLYAQWDPHEYDILYNNNASYNKDAEGNPLLDEDGKPLSGIGSEFTGVTDNIHHIWGSTGTIALNNYALEGYYFLSWNTKADGSGDTYAEDQKVKNLTSEDGGKITLYAQWGMIASASHTPLVIKELTGEKPKGKETFEFVITANTTKAPMPAKDQISVTGEGQVSFGSMIFYREGVYEYTIHEKTGKDPNYHYDTEAVTMTVKVTENISRELEAQVSYRKAGEEVSVVLFTNSYTQPKADVTPVVTKRVLGNTLKNGATFQFELSPFSNDAPMPEGSEDNLAKVSISGPGTIPFSGMTFKDAGTYVYRIRELPGSDAFYVYDDKPVTMTVKVVEKDYQVLTTVTYHKQGGLQDTETAEFLNYYTLPVTSDPPVEKIVQGNPAHAGTFTFLFVAKDLKNPMPMGSTKGVKEMSLRGQGSVEFGEIEFTKAGTFVYTIAEKDNGETGYTYDKTVFTITYVVTEKEGVLEVQRTITAKESAVEKAVFTNLYSASKLPGTSLPQTGESDRLGLWLVFVILSMMIWIGEVLYNHQKRKELR